jgi:hypothetical protein
MNEFELQLESELRRFLDPISAAPPPSRRGKRAKDAPRLELRVITPERLAPVRVEIY